MSKYSSCCINIVALKVPKNRMPSIIKVGDFVRGHQPIFSLSTKYIVTAIHPWGVYAVLDEESKNKIIKNNKKYSSNPQLLNSHFKIKWCNIFQIILADENQTYEIEMNKDDYDILNNDNVKKLYPMLYKQVYYQKEKKCLESEYSCIYELTYEAKKEYKKYLRNYSIGYIHKPAYLIK